jgi:hypothetical protein
MKIAKPIAVSASLLMAGLLLAPCLHAVSQKPAPTPAPTRVRAKLDGFELSSKSGKSANQIGGASRDLGTPRLYAPNAGKAYSLLPTFYWATSDGAQKVTFRLSTLNGVKLYEVGLTGGHLVYPADATALTPGMTYRWTVIPEDDMLGGAPVPASITIVGGDERAAIDQELKSGSDHATVFVNHRVWYDAVAGYTATLDLTPGDQVARKGRATIYDQLPVTQPLADADWQMVH